MRISVLSTAMLALSLAAEGQVADVKGQNAWKEYVYPGDNFAITLPSEPTPHKDAQFPDVQMNVYTSGGVTLRAEYAPRGCESAITSQAKMIEEFKAGTKKPDSNFRPNLSSVQQDTLEGYPFLEFEQTVSSSTNDYERWYCVEKKLYVFSAIWPVGQEKPARVNRIVRSFRLIQK